MFGCCDPYGYESVVLGPSGIRRSEKRLVAMFFTSPAADEIIVGDVWSSAGVPSARPRSAEPTPATNRIRRIPVESATSGDAEARRLTVRDTGRCVHSTVVNARVFLHNPAPRTVYHAENV